VLFDLDGTLIDTIDVILAAYAQAGLAVLGVAPDPAEARRWIGCGLADTYQSRYPPEQATALMAAYRAFYADHFESLARRCPGVLELVQRLVQAGMTCAVATSRGGASAEASLAFVGLTGLVEVVASAETTERHKPDPAPLLAAAARLSADPGRMVYVGDALVDLQAARAAGMACLLVTWGAGTVEELTAAGPDGLARDSAELARLLLPGAV
jgi:pyrophosphatase PpaX